MVRFAEIITKGIRETDYSARWGGEEFMLVCPNTMMENAYSMAIKLVQTVSESPFPFVGSLTCSIGVSTSEEKKNHRADACGSRFCPICSERNRKK